MKRLVTRKRQTHIKEKSSRKEAREAGNSGQYRDYECRAARNDKVIESKKVASPKSSNGMLSHQMNDNGNKKYPKGQGIGCILNEGLDHTCMVQLVQSNTTNSASLLPSTTRSLYCSYPSNYLCETLSIVPQRNGIMKRANLLPMGVNCSQIHTEGNNTYYEVSPSYFQPYTSHYYFNTQRST